ncbi:MAG: dihydropteroate synthase [Euryarchaeota archaeon RBG_16_67_27]|nr:MAG: dihydropteroate synthase [Euryarchaeota archaeon RBG_16_67_27]
MLRAVAEPLVWRHRTGEIVLDRPRVMGILNVTPDSFSDGGRYLEPDAAIRRALEMVAQGADLIDIGGESTRPGSDPIPADEEWRRIRPVFEGLVRTTGVPLSVDTRKPEVAARALEAGASIVNDVSGLRDPEMVRGIAGARAGAVIVHMLGEPKTMQVAPSYGDVVAEVRGFLAARIETAVLAGVPREALAVDPGIGFGKALDHNLELLAHIGDLTALGRPVVIGVSRKSFLGALFPSTSGERLSASLAAAAFAVIQGAQVVRVHDVAETVRALQVVKDVRVAQAPRSPARENL